MEDAMHPCHSFEDVLLLASAGKKAKATDMNLRTKFGIKRTVDLETNNESLMPSKMRHNMNARWDYIGHKVDVSKGLDCDISVPKIPLLCNCVEQICCYRTLQ
jgi:hypothetical protein